MWFFRCLWSIEAHLQYLNGGCKMSNVSRPKQNNSVAALLCVRKNRICFSVVNMNHSGKLVNSGRAKK